VIPNRETLVRAHLPLCDAKRASKILCRNAASTRMLRQTEKILVGNRAYLATLRLGRKSGASGDEHPPGQHGVSREADRGCSFLGEILTFVGPCRLRTRGDLPRRQVARLKPTVVAYPRAVLRVPVTLSHARIRATGAGSLSSPRPLRVAVGPKRQARSGNLCLGSVRLCRSLRLNRPASGVKPSALRRVH